MHLSRFVAAKKATILYIWNILRIIVPAEQCIWMQL